MSLFLNVNVVSIQVKDWDSAKKFYADLLEWPLAFGDDNAGWWEFGRDNETHVSISKWTGEKPLPLLEGRTTLVLAVEDAFKVTAALKSRGIKTDEVETIPGMVTYGACYDPEGNRIQFVSIVPPPAA